MFSRSTGAVVYQESKKKSCFIVYHDFPCHLAKSIKGWPTHPQDGQLPNLLNSVSRSFDAKF
jgi:hypothetical protein